MKVKILFALFLATALAAQQPRRPASQTEARYQSATANAERKFQHIAENAQRPSPDQTPSVITESEVNAYVMSGNVKLPTGVKSVRFSGRPGVIDATAR